jgi:hypothetical protein
MSINFLDTERAYSDVQGATLASVATQISQQGDAGQDAGKAEWFPNYVLMDADPPGVVVTIKTRITMPRWQGYASAPQGERDEWDRFFSALEAHEQGHIDLVKRYLSGIDEQMAGQSSDVARQIWANALQDLQSASDSYDEETDHGRNQGTTINVSTPDITAIAANGGP